MTIIDSALLSVRDARARLVRVSSSYQYLYCGLAVYVAGSIIVDPQAFLMVFFAYSQALFFLLPAFFLIVLLICVLLDKRPGLLAKMRRLLEIRAVRIAHVVLGFLVCVSAFTAYKVAIPKLAPFYADPFLSALDAWLHGGAPWQSAHAIWPASWANFLWISYETIWHVLWVSTPLFVALALDRELQKRYYWSFFLSLLMNGTILAIAFSSVGPVFYADFFEGINHDGLTERLKSLSHDALRYPTYLLANYKNDTAAFGSGISAMPSIHVSAAVLNAYLFSSVNKWLGFLMWVFALVILFGSVYTGWHYAVDGYVSFIVVTIIWFAVKHAHRVR